jgi:hypothetical protein
MHAFIDDCDHAQFHSALATIGGGPAAAKEIQQIHVNTNVMVMKTTRTAHGTGKPRILIPKSL